VISRRPIELGLDLTVCVSLSCQPLFSEPLQ
jgi:hypothetical protein